MSENKSYVSFYKRGNLTSEQVKDLFEAVKKYDIDNKVFVYVSDKDIKEINIKKAGELAEDKKGFGMSFKINFKEPKTWPEVTVAVGTRHRAGGIYTSVTISMLQTLFEPSDMPGKDFEKSSQYKNQEMFLELLKGIYNIVHPELGFSGTTAYEGDTTYEWLEKLEVRYISSIMFFGPAYVKKYGKINLLKTYGAWKIDAFKDGGIMIVVKPYGVPWFEKHGNDMIKAESILFTIFGIRVNKRGDGFFY